MVERAEVGSRIAIVFGQMRQMFEQHLAFPVSGRVEIGGQTEFDAGQEQREGHGLDHGTDAVLLLRKTQFGGIGGDDAPAMPARTGALALDQRYQLGQQRLE
jgi:hypothetical protein